jgi:hypothetical protein
MPGALMLASTPKNYTTPDPSLSRWKIAQILKNIFSHNYAIFHLDFLHGCGIIFNVERR